jgi:DNA-binding winged helix-turn-helix (wHTH) protein
VVYIRSEALMPQPAMASVILRFDVYALNLRAGELYKSGRKVKLQELPFRILAMLLEHPGELVTRGELRQRLWSEDTFVDFEHSLNTAIKKLRQALHDEADRPRFIETLPRRGYRFVGSLAENSPSPPLSGPATDLVGKVFALRDEAGRDFVSLPIDEATLKEQHRLEAAADDLGLSLLFAAQTVLVVRTGTRVKVLEGRMANSCYEVRILEGEHTAKTALALSSCLVQPTEDNPVDLGSN